jgi:hypothetical protein
MLTTITCCTSILAQGTAMWSQLTEGISGWHQHTKSSVWWQNMYSVSERWSETFLLQTAVCLGRSLDSTKMLYKSVL